MPNRRPITLHYLPHVERHYRILSHLDLGADAANIYRRRARTPEWTGELLEAYRAAPGRLTLQVLPLWADDLEEELELLRPGRVDALADEAGRRLTALFADRLRSERRLLNSSSKQPAPPEWLDTLADCRRHLWSKLDEDCPPLSIIDVPSLACGDWSHGRAIGKPGRIVAVSFDAGRAAFVQVLHEEIHPVSDPVVRARFADLDRDTRAGTEGYRLHQELERMAIEVGEALVKARAPEFDEDYRRWRQRFRI